MTAVEQSPEDATVSDWEIRVTEHAVTTKTWTNPLGRRREDTCACGEWSASGDTRDVLYRRSEHLSNVAAHALTVEVDS